MFLTVGEFKIATKILLSECVSLVFLPNTQLSGDTITFDQKIRFLVTNLILGLNCY